MARANAIVDGVRGVAEVAAGAAAPRAAGRLERPLVQVSFDGGGSGLLDMASPAAAGWKAVLDSLHETGDPAYVEVDPETSVITELLLPLRVGVGEIVDLGDTVEVELVVSHAVHHLRRDNPDFAELLAALEAARDAGAMALVTQTLDDHEIIDVRPLPKSVAGPALVPAAEAPHAEAEPAPELAPVSLGRAQELFSLVSGVTCCPNNPSAPCIPFQFPDDGCWGRAHEMCRLMIAAGAQPAKVWIYGNLRVATANHPGCEVRWGWHVAPTLLVDAGSGPSPYVVDPALFPGPVPRATWAGVQGDPAAALVDSDAAVFHRSRGGSVSYDPTYAETNRVLTTYRRELQLRSSGSAGPPPYPGCQSRPGGVQWLGTVAGGATQRWFTHSWPASWHVLWTVMPTTHCPAGPQLACSTQVQRVDANFCTYWITVRNLTPNPVRFEGRFDVLSR